MAGLISRMSVSAVSRLAYCAPIRHTATSLADRWLADCLAGCPGRMPFLEDPDSRALTWERTMMARAVVHTMDRVIAQRLVSPHFLSVSADLWGRAIARSGGGRAYRAFEREHGQGPPWFLAISPGHDCNLRCDGCYADSGERGARLSWSTLDRIITEAKALWGIPLVVFSGGEPLAYRSEGKGVLDIVEKHPDMLFLMFTNGTLIDQKVARRLERMANLTPAISVEGTREQTDARRGPGIFNRVRKAMALLREAGVLFGVSITATRSNCDEVLSDELLDLYFETQGAFYGFLFMYMPMGRDADVEIMPTIEQRLKLWRRAWEVIVRRQIFLFDFWNQASLVHGCLAAGRPGGYLHIDWNGRVMPCVFAPYAGADINKVYAEGSDLGDVWRAPFFEGIRAWQRDHDPRRATSPAAGNWLASCPVRDHYPDFRECVDRCRPEPEDDAALALLTDDKYLAGMAAYGDDLALAAIGLCEHVYVR